MFISAVQVTFLRVFSAITIYNCFFLINNRHTLQNNILLYFLTYWIYIYFAFVSELQDDSTLQLLIKFSYLDLYII